jgi:hypothetical protein
MRMMISRDCCVVVMKVHEGVKFVEFVEFLDKDKAGSLMFHGYLLVR